MVHARLLHLRSIVLCLIGCLLASPALAAERKSPVRPWKMGPLPEGEVNLIALADWGDGSDRQKKTAQTLEKYVREQNVQFNGLLTAGDNFYRRFKQGIRDPYWKSLFEDRYDPKVINFPWYATLGNHDYESDKDEMQLEYAEKHLDSRFKLPARWYRLDLPEEAPLVSILMLDSNKMRLSKAQWARQLAWIEEQLARPRESKWLLAVAHHPLFSNGDHGDNQTLISEWGPILEKHKVDLYIAGHDHSLQHLRLDQWHPNFLIVGGGGRSTHSMRNDLRGPFSRSANGFAHLHFESDHLLVRFIDSKSGRMIHSFSIDRAGGAVKVLTSGGMDKAKKKLKDPQDFEEDDEDED